MKPVCSRRVVGGRSYAAHVELAVTYCFYGRYVTLR